MKRPSSHGISSQLQAKARAARAYGARQSTEPPATFKNFSASELFCPKCKRAMPVKEKLLLYLPGSELYDLVCQGCGSSLGSKNG